MSRTRVLVVDDSALVRRQIEEWLARDPELAVAATASNGRQGVEKFDALHPDAVVLDLEMPVMDGLTTLREIRKRDASVPIIVFSTLTSRGAAKTLEALSLGATDHVLKPTTLGQVRIGAEDVGRELVGKIKGLRAVPRGREAPPRLRTESAKARIEVVAIGASTGGPNVLETIFARLPADLPVPVLVVQHMPPFFTRILAERLGRVSPMRVEEAIAGQAPQVGEAWVAPGGVHLAVERRGVEIVLQTNEEPPENACRPAVDVLFRSVADVYGPHALGVVLTGMGQDGLAGARRLAEVGASVLVQDEGSSVVWSMPGHVARAGLASAILSPDDLAIEIARRVKASRAVAPGEHQA